MKWFKHYTDASNDAKIAALEDEFGHIGYAVYMKTLEFCGQNWDGKAAPEFRVNMKRLASHHRLTLGKSARVVRYMGMTQLFDVQEISGDWFFKIPKMLEIKDNHVKNLQATGKRNASNLPLEENRTEENRTEENRKEIKEAPPVFLNFNPDRCLELWEQLGSGDCPNLAKSFMFSGPMNQDFANLMVTFLPGPEEWEAYFRGLDDTQYGEDEGFSLPLALKEKTYLNYKNGVYKKRKAKREENPFG